MINVRFRIGVMLAAAVMQPGSALSQAGTAPPQCWTNGVAVPCPAPSAAGNAAQQPTYYPTRRQYPPSWYYNPYNAPWFQCHLCGE